MTLMKEMSQEATEMQVFSWLQF